MTRPIILVTGATGKTGGPVVERLLADGWPVRAVVHRIDARSERLQALGADVVTADVFDPEQLAEAMRGAPRAYYCPPWHPHMLHSAVAFATAARSTGVEVIVGLSQWLASPAHPSLATRQNHLTEDLFAMVPGAAHINVNPGFFADNYLRLVDFPAQLGLFPMPIGDSRNAPPSNEDIARVVVAALTDPNRHAGRTYRPTGPALLDASEMATILGRVLDRKVRHVDMPMWMFLKALRALKLDAFQQSGLRHYLDEHRRGTFELGAPTTDVADVTGRPAESFETIARRYAALPAARRTAANKARALATFARIGLTPAHDLDRLVTAQEHPAVTDPRLAIDTDSWRQTHLPLDLAGGAR